MTKKNTILVTGAGGFIGKALCVNLSKKYNVIGIDTRLPTLESGYHNIVADIVDTSAIHKICETYNPSVVVHCAGIAHQAFAKSCRETYFKVNSDATEHLAEIALKSNPDVHFIYLSSMNVYGEILSGVPFKETDECCPTSDYALSKLDAEDRLKRLTINSGLKKVDILRLAPVYDINWSVNLEKRVFAPRKVVYLRHGAGRQAMSAVFRQNMIDFIDYRLNQKFNTNQSDSINTFCNVFNVCDDKNYKFSEIIRVFKKSDYQPNRFVVFVPLSFICGATRMLGFLFKRKRKWLHSNYDKLARSLIFDNTKMLETGFRPKHSLESVFLNEKNSP